MARRASSPIRTFGEIPAPSAGPLFKRLYELGVVFRPHTVLRRIEGRRLVVANAFTGVEDAIDGVDNIVVFIGDRANDDLLEPLRRRVGEVHAIGDCLAPRRAIDAIREGERVGRLI